MPRAEPVGEASQPAAAKKTPTMMIVVAIETISEVPIDQAASAAGLTFSCFTNWSTTMPPATLRSTTTRSPATISPTPLNSTVTQRPSRVR